jgi:hypothetical protein
MRAKIAIYVLSVHGHLPGTLQQAQVSSFGYINKCMHLIAGKYGIMVSRVSFQGLYGEYIVQVSRCVWLVFELRPGKKFLQGLDHACPFSEGTGTTD